MSKQKQVEFMEAYKPIHPNFERFCRARVYGEMDYRDLMNETLMRAFDKWDSLRSKEAFLSYLFSIAVKVLANANRKLRNRREESMGENHTAVATDASVDAGADIDVLHQTLAKLPEDQKEALILFEINGFSIKEISEIQNSGESAVKQRLRRGRIRLKELLHVDIETSKNKMSHG